MGFNDIFHDLKMKENNASIQGLASLISELDGLNDDLIDRLLLNILAGNMFDWGFFRLMLDLLKFSN